MAEINDFPSGTSSRPSHTLDRAAALRNVFGEEPPPPPPPLPRVSEVFWEQFLRERPGTIENNQNETANDEDESSLRSNEDGMESETAPSAHECGQMLVVPQCGMEFPSEERAYNFYKNYAARLGFKVRKGKVQRTSNGMIQKRFLLCSKEGERSKKTSDNTPRSKRKETRTGCKAEIRIELKNGKWVIYSCSLGHNHELEMPGQRHESDTYYPDNSQVAVRECAVDGARVVDTEAGTAEDRSSEEVGQRLELDTSPDNSQVVARESTGDGTQVVDEEGGTAENRSPEEVRVSNYLPDKNVAKLAPDDVQSLLNCFSHLQAEDPSFFYAIQLNPENRMTSFFWRDGRSRIDYAYFADLLVLDTCRYQMDNNVICAPFFGVNHHMDPVLFGCAFLLDETEESFRWLFRTFLEAMGYSQPKTLFTALSEVIARAAEKEFPETKHRIVKSFILWEFQVKHLPTYFNNGLHFEDMFNECLYEVRSKQEFEERWNLLMEEYKLREDPWLAIVYKSREKWSYLFSEELAFPADLESLIDLEDDKNATLSDIFVEYLKKTEKFRSCELSEDFDSNSMQFRQEIGMKEHAADIYTCEVFEEFEREFENFMSLSMEEVSPGPTCVFKLKHFEADSQEEEVRFDCSSSTVSCSCKKFERMGILCSHSLKVLNAKNIFLIPEQYVLKRWTRSAKRGVEVKGNSARDNMDEKSRRLHSRNLLYKALNVITKSVATAETRKIVEHHLDSALQETEASMEKLQHTNLRDDEICCGEKHCPFGKRKKIGSASSSDWEVYGS